MALLRGGGLAGIAQGEGWVLLEDAIDLANWLVDSDDVPLYADWDDEAAAEIRAGQAAASFEGLL